MQTVIDVYGKDVINCNSGTEEWIDVTNNTDDLGFDDDDKIEKVCVPTSGTDESNIPQDLQRLNVPCFCFYNNHIMKC